MKRMAMVGVLVAAGCESRSALDKVEPDHVRDERGSARADVYDGWPAGLRRLTPEEIEPGVNWWCEPYFKTAAGDCYRALRDCDEKRLLRFRNGQTTATCIPLRGPAWCLTLLFQPPAGLSNQCWPTRESCQWHEDLYGGEPGRETGIKVMSPCDAALR